jgi:hypothetical protein
LLVLMQAQSSIASTFNYTLELLKLSQDAPGVLSSMLFTISRALRVCKNLPDSDYLLMKLTDGMRALVDHLDAYEDFTGLALVGCDMELVDFEEWVHGPRNNESLELTMLDLGYRLRLANPASSFRPEYEQQDNRIAAPPNLAELLAQHQRQQQGVAAAGGGSRGYIDLTGGGYRPTSPAYVPTHQAAAAAGGSGMPVTVPIPIPVPLPMLGAPIAVVGGAPVVTTHGPTPPSSPRVVGAVSPRIRRAGAPSPDDMITALPAPVHRVDSVEHLFIPDEVHAV